jgi:hypothetical protein
VPSHCRDAPWGVFIAGMQRELRLYGLKEGKAELAGEYEIRIGER